MIFIYKKLMYCFMLFHQSNILFLKKNMNIYEIYYETTYDMYYLKAI